MMFRKAVFNTILLILLMLIFLIYPVILSGKTEYKKPPALVEKILNTPPFPGFVMSPDGNLALLVEYDPMPGIEYLSRPLLKLAGIRLLPENNSRQVTTFYTGLTILNLKNGQQSRVKLPENIKMGYPRWSPDGSYVAFLQYEQDKVTLWILDVKTKNPRKIYDHPVNTTLTRGFVWGRNSSYLLLLTVPDDRGPAPQPPSVPEGPIIYETSGKKATVRTYQDLLKDDFDIQLFDYYCVSQIVKIYVQSGETEKIGKSGIYLTPSESPDGKYLLVYSIVKPYSFSVPYYYFAHDLEIWDTAGRIVKRISLPLSEEIPIRGVPTGPRRAIWRPFRDAELLWVEALDGGDPRKKVEYRDRLMRLSAPFTAPAEDILYLKNRFRDIQFLEDGKKALVTEYNWRKRWRTTFLVNLEEKGGRKREIFSLSAQDRYNDPGDPVLAVSKRGEYYIPVKRGWIFLAGQGSSPGGDFPFLHKFNLKTRKTVKLFRSADGRYERFIDFVGGSYKKAVIRSESPQDSPNYYLLNLKNGKRSQLTSFDDPFPELREIKKELITYFRDDSVLLSGTLYLPADYQQGERLPLVVWAYPREYSDPKVAGQVKGSPYRFLYLRGTSPLFFVTQGYAVLYNAQMPVIGDPETMNNTFVEQIVASAKAAIDKLDSMGIIDRERVGVAGHSYGAFMTANLLAHSDLFAAGIARSGAYNRTLTPFGFQNERRTLWEAPEIYFKVSPFMFADKVNEPILLIHGMEDNNSGTFPLQSRRFFHALKGHGATARLVMLPHESHGYRAKESIEHVLAEMIEWFDRYVKNK